MKISNQQTAKEGHFCPLAPALRAVPFAPASLSRARVGVEVRIRFMIGMKSGATTSGRVKNTCQ